MIPARTLAAALETIQRERPTPGLINCISAIRSAADRDAARDALLLTVARAIETSTSPHFVNWRETLHAEIAAVEALAAPPQSTGPLASLDAEHASRLEGMRGAATAGREAANDREAVMQWAAALSCNMATARAALARHREKVAGLEATAKNQSEIIVNQGKRHNELINRLAALERPAPEPTEEELRVMTCEIEDCIRNIPISTAFESGHVAATAYRVAAQRRPAIGVPKELLARLRDAKKPSLQPAARALEWQRVALEAAEWVLTCGSQPAAPEPPDLERLVEIGRKAWLDAGIYYASDTDKVIEIIARTVLAAAHPAPADPLAPWVYRARKVTRALDGRLKGSISSALTFVRELAAAGGGGA